MIDFFRNLLSTDFMPHGHCYLWMPEILWLHAGSDILIALAYYSIPLALLAVVRARNDLKYNWMLLLFAAFIFLCGTTHLFNIWSIWHGMYRLEGTLKLLTGVVSVVTALLLWSLVPKIVAIPSRKELESEIAERTNAQLELELARNQLESRVLERTAELERVNQQLRHCAKIIDSSRDAILSVTPAGLVTSWNIAAEKMFGYSAEEMSGQPLDRLLDGKPKEELLDDYTGVLAGNSLSDKDTIWKSKDGAAIPASLTLSPVCDSSGANVEGISIIVRDISERVESQKHFQNSLKQKELLLKEVHHRVKNNLQVISSLLKIQTGYLTDEQGKSALRQSDDRIRSMALVHEKLYRSEELNRVDFKSYVQELTSDLTRTYSKPPYPTIDLQIESVELSIEKAIPCGLILNELVSNALKHAFKDTERTGAAKITISLNHSPAEYETLDLVIADNGSGLPAAIDSNNPKSMGLKIVKTLCEQLKSELKIERDQGTLYRISFLAIEQTTNLRRLKDYATAQHPAL